MKWYIPDCFWPVKDQGDYLGHEAVSYTHLTLPTKA